MIVNLRLKFQEDSSAPNGKTVESSSASSGDASGDAEKGKTAGKLNKKSENGAEDEHDEDDTGFFVFLCVLRPCANAVFAAHTGKFYDEVEIEDMEFDEKTQAYYYPCPCGDRFVITKEDLGNGEEIARCPSCSLIIKVIYDPEDFARESEDDNDDDDDENEGDGDD